ncbi:MAG: tyrosine-type recombinase/integrase [Fidelibacterota bacterium]
MNEIVTRVLQNEPRNGIFVFSNADGEQYRDIKNGFRAAVRRAKIKHCRFHDLRHSFASHIARHNSILYIA